MGGHLYLGVRCSKSVKVLGMMDSLFDSAI